MTTAKAMQPTAIAREMPNSLESERALLGSILLRPNSIEKVIDIIKPGDFYRGSHRVIYESMVDLYGKRDAIDVVTLSANLEKRELLEQAGGMVFLSELTEEVPTSHNIVSYAHIIADKAVLRDLLETTWGIIEEGYSSTREVREIVDEAEAKIFKVGQREVKSTLHPMNEVLTESLEHLDKFFQEGDPFTGTPTGFTEFDKITNGLQPGELAIIAARPSMGKSAFAFNIATNVAGQGIPAVVFTLEMSAMTCGIRMLCSYAQVDLQRLRNHEADKEDWLYLTKAGSALAAMPLFVDDSGLIGVDEIRAKCRRIKADRGLGLVIIDYLQLMKPREGITSREQQISDMSRTLKQVAKELAVPVVVLSQLNRGVESREDKRPRLSDIRESGAVEQDADLICFIYRDEYYNPEAEESRGKAEIIISKHRNGPIGQFELQFEKRFARFNNLEWTRDDPY